MTSAALRVLVSKGKRGEAFCSTTAVKSDDLSLRLSGASFSSRLNSSPTSPSLSNSRTRNVGRKVTLKLEMDEY